MKNNINIENFLCEKTGTIKWEIQKNKVHISSFLVDLLALPNFDKEQNYDDWRALDHPDGMKEYREAIQKYREGNADCIILSLKTRKLCRDGTYKWFVTSGEISKFDDNGKPEVFHGTCMDVTLFYDAFLEFSGIQRVVSEINRLAKSVKETHSFDSITTEVLLGFSKILETTNCCFIKTTKNDTNKIIFVNDFKNQKTYHHSIFESDPIKESFINEVLKKKENQIKSFDNRHFLGLFYPLPFASKEVIIIEHDDGFDYKIFDVLAPFFIKTKYILIDYQMKEANNNVHKLVDFFFEQIPVQVAMFDKDMHLLYATMQWKKQRNLNLLEDYRGRNYYEMFPDVAQKWKEEHDRVLAGESVSSPKLFVQNYFGKEAWIEFILRPWHNLNAEIAGLIVYSNNITEKVKAEAILENTVKELNRSNEDLERFAQICSHDLKEPLRSISSFAAMLRKESGGQLSETAENYLNYILKNTARMDALIRDILTYAKLSNSSEGDKRTPIQTNAVVKEVIASLSQGINETKAQLKIADLPETFGHKTQIFQLFLNLLGNALKYRSEQPAIKIFSVDKGDCIEFHIKDNGIGIDKEYHDAIFDFSKRLHGSKEYEGAGIGLSSCKKIVDNHNGTIGVQSTKGVGSDFYFTLPKA